MDYTIRWNGTREHRIVTFKQQFYERLLSSHPWAVSTWIGKLLESMYYINGLRHTLDYDQDIVLSEKLNCWKRDDSVVLHYIEKWFVDGTRIMDCPEKSFDVYCEFAKMLYGE